MSLTASATVAAAQHTGATPTRRADSASTAADSLGRQQRLKTVTIAASPLRPDAPSNGIHLPAARFTDMAANSPWDVLRQAAGVEVHQQGQGPGFASDASMRGFSSDHSTDLALWIDGAPIDEPVNGHAEGYADWNLLFPRAISGIDIARGPTRVLFGDFPIAGSANVQTKERMRGSIVSFDGGSTASALNARQGSGGLFAALESDLSRRFHLSVGARVDQLSTTSVPDDAASLHASHGTISPKLGLSALFADNATAFANVSRGFKSTDGTISDPTLPLIQTWAYETGVRLHRGEASATLAVYRMDVNNEQTFDPLTNGSSSGGASRRRGIEVDWSVPIVPTITTHGSWSFNDTVYTSSVIGADDPTAAPTVLSGLRVYNTARYVGSADAEWSKSDRFATLRVVGTFIGSYAPFDEPGVEVGGYGLLHLSGSLRLGPRALLRMTIRNALDRRYPELIARHIVSPGQPRALGAGFDVTF